MAKTRSSTDATELYTALGKALNVWSGVEYALCGVFCDCLNPYSASPAERAYWAVISFDARLEMVTEVIRGRFQHKPQLVVDWETIREHLKKRVRQRNKLAHSSVIRMSNYNRKKSPPDLFLSPFHWSVEAANIPTESQMASPRYDARPKDRLYASGIDEVRKSFHGSLKEIRSFRDRAWQIIRPEAIDEIKAEASLLPGSSLHQAHPNPEDIAIPSQPSQA